MFIRKTHEKYPVEIQLFLDITYFEWTIHDIHLLMTGKAAMKTAGYK